MDSLTHIVLGAVIGELVAGRRLGKKALVLGAIAQSLPDIDFVASFWLDTARDVAAHRGITHSLLFVFVVSILLAWWVRRWRFGQLLSGRGWFFFFGLEMCVHLFIDAFNAYGTGWFEPFSHRRISFHTLFVADPFFSVWVGISAIVLVVLRSGSPVRKYWAWGGLFLSGCYLLTCLISKHKIDERVAIELRRQGLSPTRFFTTPTPLNSWLWFVVAEDSGGFRTGYASVFDRHPEIPLTFFPKNDSLLDPVRTRRDLRYLLPFSGGYYTAERWHDTVVFNDLRFGQMRGWERSDAHFVFHYFISGPGISGGPVIGVGKDGANRGVGPVPDANRVVVQRGRFAGWDREAITAFIRRIRGD